MKVKLVGLKEPICPDVETFREELPKVKDLLEGKEKEQILLYCTGGIRCEKASAYLKIMDLRMFVSPWGSLTMYVS